MKTRPTRAIIDVVRGALDELFPDPLAGAAGQDADASAVEAGVADADAADRWQPDAPDAYCPRCGASAGPGAVTPRGCAFCLNESVPWQRLVRLGAYREPLAERIRLMKFHRQWRWARWLGDQLADRLDAPFDATRFVLCPVPLHWTRRWQRGYDQAALMAERIAWRRDWLRAPLLRRVRGAPPQTAIPPSRRADNVRGAYALREPRLDLMDWEVLLIDDVKTSGATLRNATRVLRQAGARSVRVAVAAVGDPRGDDFTRV